MLFFKTIFKEDTFICFIPGTVTTNLNEAYKWYRIYLSSKKNKFFINRKGIPIIISFEFSENKLLSYHEFQKSGISEHNRKNCWTSSLKTKAQINEVIKEFEQINFDNIINQIV